MGSPYRLRAIEPTLRDILASLWRNLCECAVDTRIGRDPVVLWQTDGELLIDFTDHEDNDEGAADQYQ